MNVSFLSSSGSFNGIDYNLSKVEKSEAKLMGKQNLEALEVNGYISKTDYKDYFTAWSDRNTRVKDTQLHVAISCRGREKTPEELYEAAKIWLKEMGYGDCPAIFVLHQDTENNHIHIVASRIDKDGKKVNDSHEVRRGKAIIDRLSVTLEDRLQADERAINEYSVGSINQYKLLWELRGYSVSHVDGGLRISKDKIERVVSLADIERKLEAGVQLDEHRAKQLKAIISKYALGRTPEEMSKILKTKMGLDLVFFGDSAKPYGYAIIDHKNKAVYKGSDVLTIKQILYISNQSERAIEASKMVKELLNSRIGMTIRDVNDVLRENLPGYYVKGGSVYQGKTKLIDLDDSVKEAFKYSYRLHQACQIVGQKPIDVDRVAEWKQVSKEDIEAMFREGRATYEKSKEERAREASAMIGAILDVYKGSTEKEINTYLKENLPGYYVKGGEIFWGKTSVGHLSDELKSEIEYNYRLYQACQIVGQKPIDVDQVAEWKQVTKEDIEAMFREGRATYEKSKEERAREASSVIRLFMVESLGAKVKDINAHLKENLPGYYVKGGEIFWGKTSVGHLPYDVVKALEYNYRLADAAYIFEKNPEYLDAVAEWKQVSKEDIEAMFREGRVEEKTNIDGEGYQVSFFTDGGRYTYDTAAGTISKDTYVAREEQSAQLANAIRSLGNAGGSSGEIASGQDNRVKKRRK